MIESTARDAYPNVNLLEEAKKARAWESTHPKKTNHAKFLNSWWAKAQDDANRYKPQATFTPAQPLIPKVKDWGDAHLNELEAYYPGASLEYPSTIREIERLMARTPEEVADFDRRAAGFRAADAKRKEEMRAAGLHVE